MVVAPKKNVGLPPETATGLLSGASVVELLGGSLLQPTITMVADMSPMMIAFFIKRNCDYTTTVHAPMHARLS
jgi:hypothetical protein